jgi:hypothetical protein
LRKATNPRGAALKIDRLERGFTVGRDRFLTLRWNNILSLGLGLIVLVYVVGAVAAGVWSEKDGFIGMAVLGAVY